MAVENLEVKVEVKQPADKVWTSYVHGLDKTLPAVMPGHFTDVVYVDGPPLTPGSTFMLTYHEDVPHYDFVKFKWDEMNHEEHRFKCTVIDGGALNKNFSHLVYSFFILPASTLESCVMKFNIEYVDIESHDFHGFLKEELEKFCYSLESHLSEKK